MKWFEKIANFLERRGRHRTIPRANGRLLERWYIIRGLRLGVYLHQFWSSDDDDFHDHPWDSFSWIIHGGYWECLPDGQRLWRSVGFKKYRTAEEFHRIELQPGTEGHAWTIFIRFKRRRKWGFWHPTGWKEATYQGGE